MEWYHTLELAPGVETPGWFDTRPLVAQLPFPASLAGKRCLDVGTFDGFWAFEMERRGASEVLAVDVIDPQGWDWPADSEPSAIEAIAQRKGRGEGFEVAKEALGSRVTRRELSSYDLDPADVGRFHVIYVGSLLLHLRDPIGALMRVRAVCDGTALMMDRVSLLLSALAPGVPLARLDGKGRPWWWNPNRAALLRYIEAAGFEVVGKPRRVSIPPGRAQVRAPLRPRTMISRGGREALLVSRRGDPHLAVLARPANA
ncbi:MAG: tRNA (mo5U34)-methyltransferase [Actinomycetota bacterium]|nr:tRNA (mo5U34)-methyltransferase [Actinomycetota bacterium]